MSDELETTKSVADATGKAIDRLGQAGEFFDKVFGDLVTDGVGIVADKIKYYRYERAILLAKKVEDRLLRHGIQATIPAPPNISIKLIEEATLCDDDALHTKWANLLTNALNPEFDGKVTRSFVSILSELEPIDAQIIDLMVLENKKISSSDPNKRLFEKDKLAKHLGADLENCEISLRNLMRLGLIRPGVISNPSMTFGGEALTIYKDTDLFSVTSFGIEFVKAASD